MIYFYDGTKQGFLTTLLLAFSDKQAIITSTNAQLAIGQQTVFVRTDEAKAKKVLLRLEQLDQDAPRDLDVLLRSGEKNADMVALNYFKLLAKEGRPVRNMLASDDVLFAVEHMRKVTYEIHRLHGFLRFMESASGALYAPISPDNDICDLLLPHFRARLPKYPFVIHDIRRKKAAIYDGVNTFLAPLEEAEVVLSADEEGWQSLFRKYYNSVNIPQRERLKQMRGYMPVRYWKFMPEKKTD